MSALRIPHAPDDTETHVVPGAAAYGVLLAVEALHDTGMRVKDVLLALERSLPPLSPSDRDTAEDVALCLQAAARPDLRW